MTSLRSLWLNIYLGPAIVYVKRYLWEELTISRSLHDVRPDLYYILLSGGLVSGDYLTPLGNKIFACTSLVEYNVLASTDLMIERVGTPNENYDLLRKGLGEQALLQSVDYIEFMHNSLHIKPEVILDLCGGDGTYLQLLGERYGAKKCFLMDKDTSIAVETMGTDDDYRYIMNEYGDVRTYNLPFPYKADLILLNEVLHLDGDHSWWTECIGAALRNSKPDAAICIGELLPDHAFDWRMKTLTSRGRQFCIEEFQDFLRDHYKDIFYHNFNYIETDTHWFCLLKRKK